MYTTVADFRAQAGGAWAEVTDEVLAPILDKGERALRRLVGREFFDPNDRAAPASRDWIEATVIVAERLLILSDPEVRLDALGPYQSKRIGPYGFTLRERAGALVTPDDPELAPILAPYLGGGAELEAIGVRAAGPTRQAEREGRPVTLLDRAWGDISRGGAAEGAESGGDEWVSVRC